MFRLSDRFFGKDPNGKELGFTNYYMILDGEPCGGLWKLLKSGKIAILQ